MPPITFVAIRFCITVIPAIFFIKKPNLPLYKIALYGLLTFAGQFTFLFSAMHAGLSPGLASLMMPLQAFFTMGFAAFFLRERPQLFQILGAGLSVAGLVVVACHIGGEVTIPSLLMILCATASWGGGNVLTKTFGRIEMFGLVVWGSLFACIALLMLACVMEGPSSLVHAVTNINADTIFALGYTAYISTFVGYTIWNVMLARYSAATVAPFALLVPPFGLLSAYLFLHEAYPLWKFAATLLIIAGLGLNQFGGKLYRFARQSWAPAPTE